jgi:hypothetical protein
VDQRKPPTRGDSRKMASNAGRSVSLRRECAGVYDASRTGPQAGGHLSPSRCDVRKPATVRKPDDTRCVWASSRITFTERR